MSIWEYANPTRFMRVSAVWLPWVTLAAVVFLVAGLVWGFFFTPDDYRQGSTVKIFFIHVPSAVMATGIWFMMLIASLVWLIRRHHVSALAAKAAAPIGIAMIMIALFSGAVWGEPMWGTWWAWDPRLTAFFILFLFYLGYVALWQAIENPDTAADLTSVLCLVGTVFAIISRYATAFWGQGLHQGSTMSLDREEHIADVFWYPAVLSMIGFGFLFVALLLLRTRTEIRARRLSALLARERMG